MPTRESPSAGGGLTPHSLKEPEAHEKTDKYARKGTYFDLAPTFV